MDSGTPIFYMVFLQIFTIESHRRGKFINAAHCDCDCDCDILSIFYEGKETNPSLNFSPPISSIFTWPVKNVKGKHAVHTPTAVDFM